jgi:alpha-ribazole phosphatase
MAPLSEHPLRLHFVRHGQTECSREDRFCGDLDVPLNETGRATAVALADRLAEHPWQALYSSPRLRARQTAEPLAARVGLPIQIEQGLRELAYGAWEGLLETEVRERFPAEYSAWNLDPGRVAPPGGETGFAILMRALPVVEEIRRRHPTGNVLAVAHKATIRILVCGLLGIDIGLFRDRVAQPVGGITVFEFLPGGPLLRSLADTCHLPQELKREVGS